MTRVEKISVALLKPINPSFIIVLAIYTIIWGLWLVSPWWAVFGHAAVYSELAAVAPEWVWGLVAVFAGSAMMRGVLHPSYCNLLTGSFIGAIYWLLISIMYIWGDWVNTGGLTSLMIAAYCSMIWLNIKVNHRYFKRH